MCRSCAITSCRELFPPASCAVISQGHALSLGHDQHVVKHSRELQVSIPPSCPLDASATNVGPSSSPVVTLVPVRLPAGYMHMAIVIVEKRNVCTSLQAELVTMCVLGCCIIIPATDVCLVLAGGAGDIPACWHDTARS